MDSKKKNGKPKDKLEVPEKVIEKLSNLLKKTDLNEIEIKSGELSVRVTAKINQASVSSVNIPGISSSENVSAGEAKSKALKEDEQSELHIIRSPFVGMFYRSPSPTTASYVDLNQSVSKGQVLCIVEAMKVMNEIEADAAGKIEKVYVESGTPVEFNAPLFGIRK